MLKVGPAWRRGRKLNKNKTTLIRLQLYTDTETSLWFIAEVKEMGIGRQHLANVGCKIACITWTVLSRANNQRFPVFGITVLCWYPTGSLVTFLVLPWHRIILVFLLMLAFFASQHDCLTALLAILHKTIATNWWKDGFVQHNCCWKLLTSSHNYFQFYPCNTGIYINLHCMGTVKYLEVFSIYSVAQGDNLCGI